MVEREAATGGRRESREERKKKMDENVREIKKSLERKK